MKDVLLKYVIEPLQMTLDTPWLISIIGGLVLSWILTEWFKSFVLTAAKGTRQFKWLTRIGLALPIGFVPTWFTWPEQYEGLRLWVALAVGFGSWVARDLLIAARDRFAPWLTIKHRPAPDDPNENEVS